jgi:hypothetical protein
MLICVNIAEYVFCPLMVTSGLTMKDMFPAELRVRNSSEVMSVVVIQYKMIFFNVVCNRCLFPQSKIPHEKDNV